MTHYYINDPPHTSPAPGDTRIHTAELEAAVLAEEGRKEEGEEDFYLPQDATFLPASPMLDAVAVPDAPSTDCVPDDTREISMVTPTPAPDA